MFKPDQAYATLFGSVADGTAKQEFAAHNNLLDFLREDVKRRGSEAGRRRARAVRRLSGIL